jgi:hypothetical protein
MTARLDLDVEVAPLSCHAWISNHVGWEALEGEKDMENPDEF